MATYDVMARDVSNWANRDTGVLDYDRIKQCLVFAHDEIYRTCRIAAIEGRFDYDPITQAGAESGALNIPSNTVEFIQLRKKFDGRGANAASANRFTVAEARNDIRSFYGDATSRYSNYSYSREHDRLLVYPGLTESEEWQLYYYYRFEDPYERIAIEKDNIFFLESISDDDLAILAETDTDIISVDFAVFDPAATEDYAIGALVEFDGELYEALAAGTDSPIDSPDNWDSWGVFDAGDTNTKIIGVLEDNWFRDENEKALLFGALHQVFDYLDEQDQSVKYKAKFEQEIQKLNDEERRRQVLGGNVQTNFYSILI